jgi:hypothetical protein
MKYYEIGNYGKLISDLKVNKKAKTKNKENLKEMKID